ncbi:MAG TPA: integrase [Nostocaceae cyanobacterium]|nr:integrase [Nostocaceae cyanobacterium]
MGKSGQSPEEKLEEKLEAVNERLRAGKIGVMVYKRGTRLSLRATFPGKPGTGKPPHQQLLSLNIYANFAGIQRAEAEAKKIGVLLAEGNFDWAEYIKVKEEDKKSSLQLLIEKFEADYYTRRGKTRTTETTYKSDYLPAWKLLEGLEELTPENIIAAISKVPANTRKRKLMCEKLESLAKFAGLSIDLSSYTGNYGSKSAPRYIPSDKEIETTRELFADREDWQWFFGVLATYGLRPHEAFFCKISPKPPHICTVTAGKTGPREVYPFHPHWAVDWQLWKIKKPPVTGQTFKDYGQRASKFFRRRKLNFDLYELRHAWCIRMSSSKYKIPVAVAAQWAGHEPGIHLRIYNQWITKEQKHQVFMESVKNYEP